jgi:hypothetical protein
VTLTPTLRPGLRQRATPQVQLKIVEEMQDIAPMETIHGQQAWEPYVKDTTVQVNPLGAPAGLREAQPPVSNGWTPRLAQVDSEGPATKEPPSGWAITRENLKEKVSRKAARGRVEQLMGKQKAEQEAKRSLQSATSAKSTGANNNQAGTRAPGAPLVLFRVVPLPETCCTLGAAVELQTLPGKSTSPRPTTAPSPSLPTPEGMTPRGRPKKPNGVNDASPNVKMI